MPLKLSPTQVAFNARGDGSFQLPFAEQIQFFRGKLNLPTEHYDDIIKSAHDRAFIVAGATKADLLNDFLGAIDKTIAEGKGIEWFRNNFYKIVEKHGWEGWTGSDTQVGRDWRTRVIYSTNLRSSYAAGRWAQLTDPDLLKSRSFWEYVHNDTVQHPRALHLSWNGVVLRYDDPWWMTHFCPNGWGCRCRIKAARPDRYQGLPAPDDGTYTKIDRNGVVHTIPKGIDYGWDYAPGASIKQQMQGFINDKAAGLPSVLASAFIKDMASASVFAPAKTAREAAKWAVDNNLVDYADYSGVKVAVANEFNASLFEHIRDFPELRGNQEFIGTIQAQYARFRQQGIEQYLIQLRAANPGVSDDVLRIHAEKGVKLRKAKGQYAHSWLQPGVKGIAVDKQWGADLDKLSERLADDIKVEWRSAGGESVKSIADHEFGHQLDALLNIRDDAEIKALFAEYKRVGVEAYATLGRYAATNIAEFIAEGWSEYRNTEIPRPLSQKIGDVILDRYKRSKNHG